MADILIIKNLLPVSDLFISLKRLCVYDYVAEAHAVGRDLIKQFFISAKPRNV
jgi:hypothetical protein